MPQKSGRVSVLLVKKRDAKSVKEFLAQEGFLHKDFRMVPAVDNSAEYIAIPIRAELYQDLPAWRDLVVGTSEQDCPYSTAKLGNSQLSVDRELTRVQQSLWNWLNLDPIAKKDILALDNQVCPKKLEVFGDDRTLVVPRKAFSTTDEKFRSLVASVNLNDLWRHLAQTFNSPRVVRRGEIDPDSPVRESGHAILWPLPATAMPNAASGPGTSGWITVTEQGIRQSFDMTRVMFSRGNVTEKIRFGNIVQAGEVVLDMYAGIGYYTLPALVKGKAGLVHACEWNEQAVYALKHNLQDNGVADRATVHHGDCREVAAREGFVDMFDRVSLGLLPSSEGGWKTAVHSLKRVSGGWLHIHGNVPEKECREWAHWVCRSLLQIVRDDISPDWVVVCTHTERVKSFAPTVYHYVCDVFVGPQFRANQLLPSADTFYSRSGLFWDGGTFEPLKESNASPSCALDPNGALHQSWMM